MATNTEIAQNGLISLGFTPEQAKTLTELLLPKEATGEVDFASETSVQLAIRDTEPYKQRFKGNIILRDKGEREKSLGEYVRMEEEYKSTLVSNGIPSTFYDSPDDYANFIGGSVSASEVNARIQNGYQAVANTDPQVVKEFKRLYGVDEGKLVAYFLDPTKARPILERQAQAAQISGVATTQGGMEITGQQAEEIAGQGISAAEARRGFAEIGTQRGLYEAQLQGEEAISQQEQIGAALGTNTAAAQRVAAKRRQRLAEYEMGGGFSAGQQGISGLTTVGQ